jgi:hypothetical protein
MINQNIEIQRTNEDGMGAIFKGISYTMAHELKNAPFDKTYIGLVIDTDLETNTYTVRINDYDYQNVMSTIKADINDSVIILSPQNQLSQMFIYGKIDTTDYSDEE